MNKKVNLFVIGAQKCGTTSLVHLLKNHPEVATMTIKEGQFFTAWKDKYPEMTPEDFYASRFKKEAKVMIDASTSYSFYGNGEKAVQRIMDYNPQAKFIYIVREPIERTISHYQHALVRGAHLKPIDEAVLSGRFINNSKYFSCILPFTEKVSNENLLILDLRELILFNADIRKQLSIFMEIELENDIQFPVSNQSVGQEIASYTYRKWKRALLKYLPDSMRLWVKNRFFLKKLETKLSIKPDTRLQLQQSLKGEMEAFYALTGIDYRYD